MRSVKRLIVYSGISLLLLIAILELKKYANMNVGRHPLITAVPSPGTRTVGFRAKVLSQGRPVEGAIVHGQQVRLMPDGRRSVSQLNGAPTRASLTDDEGILESEFEFRYQNIHSDEIEITAYQPEIGTGYVVLTEAAVSRSYHAGESIELALERGNTIRGRILNAKDQPVPRLFVYVSTCNVPDDRSIALQGLWGTTDERGQFLISGIRFGNEIGSITYQDYSPMMEDLSQGRKKPSIKGRVPLARFRDPVTGDWDLGEIHLSDSP